jgi:hypothetical protein
MIRRKTIMDNLFEILIYGFIIISFISSFFKKKKQVKKEPMGQPIHQQPGMVDDADVEVPPSPVQKAEEYDILKEFEGFFKVGEPKQESAKGHTDKEVYEGAKNRKDFVPVPEESFHKTTASEHTFIDPWDEKRKVIESRKKAISPLIEKQASAYEESLKKKESAATEIISDIRNRMKNPSALKEYVIISEIMGKPKALRG